MLPSGNGSGASVDQKNISGTLAADPWNLSAAPGQLPRGLVGSEETVSYFFGTINCFNITMNPPSTPAVTHQCAPPYKYSDCVTRQPSGFKMPLQLCRRD